MRIHDLMARRPECLSDAERREAAELEAAFVSAYQALCAAHGLEVRARLEVTPDGIRPVAAVAPHFPETT